MNATTELEEVISIDVTAGYESREEIIENAIDFLLGDYNPEWLEEEATRLTDSLLEKHFEEQKTWLDETDCDRLDEAFAELDRHGIVARQNFTCCQTCGHTEINSEIAKTQNYRPVRGYVFFHWQDTETAVRNAYLYLAYGSISGKEGESALIAQEVVAALRRAGLEADWNDSVRTRICIKDIEWKRRRI
jgi:hypothetical protein